MPKTTRDLTAHGCMPTCIARKATEEMQAIGTDERENPSAKNLCPKNGLAFLESCSRSDPNTEGTEAIKRSPAQKANKSRVLAVATANSHNFVLHTLENATYPTLRPSLSISTDAPNVTIGIIWNT